MSARKTLVSLISLLFLLLIFPMCVHAETYILCLGCDGTGKCELCDPAKGSDRLGDGRMGCWLCHGTGYAVCGTNHTGDGTPIGCDGSGYMPDGTVCLTCNGTGRYACDVCNGTGFFDCKCRQMGIPGKCTLCYGTGWRLINSSGVCYNTTPVYPSNGSTIDTSNFGYMGTMTYDASRYGLGITAAQFEAIKNGSSGNNGGGNNGGGGTGNDQGNNPGGESAPGPQPNPPGSGDDHPDNNPPSEPHSDDNSFFTEIKTDNEIKNEIASMQDEICFICRYVDGDKLFTVKAVMSQMYDSELDAINAMTETDICDFKGHLEAAANGINFSEISESTDGIRLEFGSDLEETFPFRCEVLIEVPLTPGHDSMNLYYADGSDYYSIPCCPVRNVDSAGEHLYLIFSIDRFGKFIYSDQPIDAVNSPLPEIAQPVSDQPGQDNNLAGTAPDSVPADSVPTPDSAISDGTSKSHTPAIIIIIIAALSCVCGYFYLKNKK